MVQKRYMKISSKRYVGIEETYELQKIVFGLYLNIIYHKN